MEAGTQRPFGWRRVLGLAALVGGVGGVLLVAFPGQSILTLYGLVSIPTHMVIAPVPNEPALFWAAKHFPPWSVMVAGTVGSLIAALFDYWLLAPLINHRRVRPRFEGKRLFQASVALFHRAPFGVLVVAAFLPLPFYPFKFLSIAGGYPLPRYLAALVVGRSPRFYLVAALGRAMQLPDWLLGGMVAVGLGLFIIKTLVGRWGVRRRNGVGTAAISPPPRHEAT